MFYIHNPILINIHKIQYQVWTLVKDPDCRLRTDMWLKPSIFTSTSCNP